MLQNVDIYRMTLYPHYNLTFALVSELIFFCILITSLCIPLISLCNLEHYNFLWTDLSQLFNVISKLQHLTALFSLDIKCRKENCIVWRQPFSHYLASEDPSVTNIFTLPVLLLILHQLVFCIILYQSFPKLRSDKYIYINATAWKTHFSMTSSYTSFICAVF